MQAVLIIVGILVVVGVIIYVVQKREKQRSEQLQTVADQLGLQFHPKGDATVQDAVGHLRLFNRGHARKMQNMISGQTDDIEIAIFGYRYNTGGGQSQQIHQQTVISFQSPHLSLPEFELRPEGMFHRIGQALGYQDIDFDSHPVFSKQYLLRGPDEAAIRDFLTSEKLEFFESLQGVCVEAAGERMIYYRTRKRVKPEDVRSFMEEGFGVYGLFKQG